MLMDQPRKNEVTKTTIHFGGNDVPVSVRARCEVLTNKGFSSYGEDKIFNLAFSNPIGTETFLECSKKAKSVLIIVTDATRPTPTSKVLEHLYPGISKHPYVKFIVATGSHRAPTEKELESMFGRFYEEFKSRIFVHDSKKDSDVVYVGKTSRGTEVSFNKMVLDTDLLVPINSVEPHYFAGFTGGRKSFLPGVSAFKTIEMNHSHAIEPGAQPLRIKGNPVAEDMNEALGFIKHKKIFAVQTVMSGGNSLFAAFVGDIRGSFEAAIKSALDLYSVPLSKKGNIVVTVAAPPLDLNLYQAQKALEHGWPALEKGGIMVLVAKCWDGIGEPAFFELLSRVKTKKEIDDMLKKKYVLGHHKAARIMSMCTDFELWAVTGLDDKFVINAKMKPYNDVQTAIDDAILKIKSRGLEPSVVVLPNGGLIVPRVKR